MACRAGEANPCLRYWMTGSNGVDQVGRTSPGQLPGSPVTGRIFQCRKSVVKARAGEALGKLWGSSGEALFARRMKKCVALQPIGARQGKRKIRIKIKSTTVGAGASYSFSMPAGIPR